MAAFNSSTVTTIQLGPNDTLQVTGLALLRVSPAGATPFETTNIGEVQFYGPYRTPTAVQLLGKGFGTYLGGTVAPVRDFMPISIFGKANVGQTLTAAVASGWISNGGNWTRDGSNISGATALTYLLVDADFTHAISYKSSNLDYVPPALVIGVSLQSFAPAPAPAPPATLTISGTPATSATVGTAYSASFTASGGAGGNVFTLGSGTLPAGLSLNASTGSISGTPTTAGTAAGLSVTVTDSAAATSTSATFSIAVASGIATLTIGGTPSTTGQVGSAYSFTPTTSGGAGGNVFSISAGTLPAGLSINTGTGAITGTPSAAGTSAGIVVRVTDSASSTASLAAFTLTVAAAAADTRPRFGYAPANSTGDQTAFASLFSGMTPLTGSSNAGRTGAFNTVSSTTNYTWIAVLHSAAPSGIRIYDGTGYGGFSGAASTGIYGGADTDPLTVHGTYTNSADGNVYDMYRGNGKASTFSTFTLS